jgi:hypothetical protein
MMVFARRWTMARKRYKAEEIFYILAEARILIERWRRHYSEVRPTARS